MLVAAPVLFAHAFGPRLTETTDSFSGTGLLAGSLRLFNLTPFHHTHVFCLSALLITCVKLMIIAQSEFLCRHGIMDYSLLLGVHRNKYNLVDRRTSEVRAAAFTLGLIILPIFPKQSVLKGLALPQARGVSDVSPPGRSRWSDPRMAAPVI